MHLLEIALHRQSNRAHIPVVKEHGAGNVRITFGYRYTK